MKVGLRKNLTRTRIRGKNDRPLFWEDSDFETVQGWHCLASHCCGHLKGSPNERFRRKFLRISFLLCKSSLRPLVRLNERTNKGDISYSYTTFETSADGPRDETSGSIRDYQNGNRRQKQNFSRFLEKQITFDRICAYKANVNRAATCIIIRLRMK